MTSPVILCLQEILTYILGVLLLSGFVFLYILSLPLFLYRFALSLFSKDNPVSSQSHLLSGDLFYPHSPRNCIVVLITLDSHVSLESFRELFEKMVSTRDPKTEKLLYPEWKQYIEKRWGYCFWKDEPNFNVHDHVKGEAFRDGDGDTTALISEDIRAISEELLNKKFTPGKSPWEVFIMHYNYIEGGVLSPGQKSLLILRIHHSMADGYSILYSLIEGALKVPLTSIRLPTSISSNRRNTLTFPARLAKDVGSYFLKGARKHPWGVPDKRKDWQQIYGKTEPIPIEKLKEIKNGLGVSFTSVLLAVVSAGMSKVIAENRKEQEQETINMSKLSQGQEDEDPAAFFIPLPLPGHPNGMKNHVTGAQIDLPMKKYADPVLRVRDCEIILQQQKQSTIPHLLGFIAKTMGYLPIPICTAISSNRVNVAALTSFPAGEKRLKLGICDGSVESVELLVGGLDGIAGAVFTAISYGSQMSFGVTAETSVLSRTELNRLLQLIVDEIDHLHGIVVGVNGKSKR